MTVNPRVCIILAALSVIIGMSAQVSASLDLPPTGTVIDGYANPDSVVNRLSRRQLAPIEGLWEMTADGSLVAIEAVTDPRRETTATYRMVLVACADRSIAPGTVLGVAALSPTPNHYDARLYTRGRDAGLTLPATYEVSVNPRGSLTLKHYRKGFYVAPWRIAPYKIRGLIGHRDERPKNLDGMIRRYPSNYIMPVYL